MLTAMTPEIKPISIAAFEKRSQVFADGADSMEEAIRRGLYPIGLGRRVIIRDERTKPHKEYSLGQDGPVAID